MSNHAYVPMCPAEVRQALRAASEALAAASMAHQYTTQEPEPERELREMERNILEAAPGPDRPGVTMLKLAELAGYYCNSRFRTAVNDLLKEGRLAMDGRKVRLAP